MGIVYICKKPLHTNSRHTKFAAALSKAHDATYYITPLRLKEYIFHKFGAFDYSSNLKRLNYRPYLRLSRKLKGNDKNVIIGILREDGLMDKDTYLISANVELCHDLKKLMPSNVRVIYYIIDRYSEYNNLTEEEKACFDQRETEIIQECDMILCASQKLLSEAKLFNKHSFWFPNAVSESQIITTKKQWGTRKIGMVSDNLSRIDWSLLCQIASHLEDYTIELIGKNDLSAGVSCPKNIHIIGYVPSSNLSKYVSEWHAGLALYEKSRFNEYCCPLKYFDYSALNIPTISTTISEGKVWAELYPAIIFLADDASQIAAHVNNIIDQDQNVDYTRLARENTWTIRAEQLCTLLKNSSRRADIE